MGITCFHNGIVLSGTNKFDKGAVLVSGNMIIDVFNEARFANKKLPPKTRSVDVQNAYICPGLIDTHIHGFGGYGVDILASEPDAISKMAQLLPQYGVTCFCPTLYPRPLEALYHDLNIAVESIERQHNTDAPLRGCTIGGIHIEGPFISKERLGVHHPESAQMPDIKTMDTIIKLGKGYIRSMTVAPELKGMHEIAIMGVHKNIVMQAGHTNAEYKNILEGVQVGIHHSTHFFNAMSPLNHRNPGTVGAILLQPEISCEIIADGYHVHPLIITLLLRNKSVDKIVLVTDALTPTQQASSPLYANGEEVYLKEGLFHRKKDDVIAGSALTMKQGVKNLKDWGVPIEHAIRMATANPAAIIHIPKKGMLSPGYDADITIFDQELNVQCTMIRGHIVYTSDTYKELI